MQVLAAEAGAPARARVAFVIPRWSAADATCLQGVPFRCMPVVGALLRHGHEVVFCDQETDLDRADRSTELRAALAGVQVAFVWMAELEPMLQSINSLALARRLVEWCPGIRVAVGGAFVSILPPEAFDLDLPVDWFVRGYGEAACPALLAAVAGERPFADVPGLVWREPDGTLRHNEPPHGHRIDARDFVAYERLDLAPFVQAGDVFGNGAPTLTVAFTHGCAKGCGFCYWRDFTPSLLPVETCIDVLTSMRDRYGVRQFHVADLDFAVNRKRALAFAAAMEAHLPDCTWFALMSPVDAVRFADAEWDLLARGGLRKIEFGSESGSPNVLRAIGKRHSPADSVTVTQKALARGIVPMHNFLFGTVGETDADRRATLQLIDRLHRLQRSWVFFTFRFFQPTWGTPMGEAAMAHDPRWPRRIDHILAHREVLGAPDRHELRWLEPHVERRIKDLVYYWLPVTTSKYGSLPRRRQRWTWRALKTVAELRLRARFFGFAADRWLWNRLVRAPLDNTYSP